MKYRESQLDIRLRKWFINSLDHQLLRGVSLSIGRIRALSKFDVSINYPLLAVAGRNGAGKSTFLAICACAFHSNDESHLLKNKSKSYYTFADFFIQHTDEVPPEGININFRIAHNNWRITDDLPEGKGVAYQSRIKKRGGKWNNYDKRVKREVIFLGIERIVPHSEKSQSKSYSKYFSQTDNGYGWEEEVKECVGYVLNKRYDEFKYVSYSRYRLPVVVSNGVNISGFNMGAGENALFEIFSILHSCKEGALIIIDEIELGLHAEAQRRLVDKLKSICLKRKVQLIFTTHSEIIFECIPNDARLFFENINNKTVLNVGLSSEYAFSKMNSDNSEELDVLVEDAVAAKLLSNSLSSSQRARIRIEIIGSAGSLARQIGAMYQRKVRKNTLALFDGDQRNKRKDNLNCALSMLEKDHDNFGEWFDMHSIYLPGYEWPERWIIENCMDHIECLSSLVKEEENQLKYILSRGLEAEKHKEFYEISIILGLTVDEVLDRCCLCLSMSCGNKINYLSQKIQQMLDE